MNKASRATPLAALRSVDHSHAGSGPDHGPTLTLLCALAGQRDRVKALLPLLLSIEGGLFGSGKSSNSAADNRDQAPQSAQEIVNELAQLLDESLSVTARIFERL